MGRFIEFKRKREQCVPKRNGEGKGRCILDGEPTTDVVVDLRQEAWNLQGRHKICDTLLEN